MTTHSSTFVSKRARSSPSPRRACCVLPLRVHLLRISNANLLRSSIASLTCTRNNTTHTCGNQCVCVCVCLACNECSQERLFRALNLTDYCGIAPPPPSSPSWYPRPGQHTAARVGRDDSHTSAATFHIDAKLGNDAAEGTASHPFRTITRGQTACRLLSRTTDSLRRPSRRSSQHDVSDRNVRSTGCTLLLTDSAPFELSDTLVFDSADSGLVIAAAPGATPVISGATGGSEWQLLEHTPDGTPVWRTTVDATTALPRSLVVSNEALVPPLSRRRLPRARWPNAVDDWETDLIPDGYTNASVWLPPRKPATPSVAVPFPAASRPYDYFFPEWVWGRGGAAVGAFDHAEGYWIAPNPAGGKTWAVPSGFVYNRERWSAHAAGWGNASGAAAKVFHGEYWGSWAFDIVSHSLDSSGTGRIEFGAGGYQVWSSRSWTPSHPPHSRTYYYT